MKCNALALLSAAAFLLTGCTTYWTRPGFNEAEFYGDRLQCEQQANGMYPAAMAPIGGGSQAPAQTNCTTYGRQTSCTTTPGSYTPPPQMDVNAFGRVSAFNACLRSKGYTPVK